MSQPPVDSPRLYVGRLSHEVRTGDIEDLFKPYGRIVDVRLMGTFGFVELDSPADAEAAIKALHGQDLKGDRLIVQSAKPNPRRGDRPPRSGPDSYGGPPPGRGDPRDRERDAWGPPPPRRERAPLRRAQYRVLLSHLPPGLSWQAIKDLGRPHGTVVFADIDPQRDDEGIIEYNFRDEMESAARALEGFEFRGSRLRADPVEAPPPPPSERDDRDRYPRSGGGPRGGYDRPPPPRYGSGRGDRYPGGPDRRPPREDRYRPRSPPPPRDDYRDDRRGGDGANRERSPGRGDDPERYARRSRSPRSPPRYGDEVRARDDRSPVPRHGEAEAEAEAEAEPHLSPPVRSPVGADVEEAPMDE